MNHPFRDRLRSILLLSMLLLFLLPNYPPLSAQNGIEENAPALYRQGEDALRRGDLYRAIDFFKEALRHNPNYMEPHRGLAQVFFRLGEYKEAQNYVGRARSLARRDTEIAALEGRISTGLGKFQEASEIFSSILRREPNNLEAQFGMAELEVARGRSKNALEVYLGALRSYPRNKRGLLSAAILYDTQERTSEARELIKTAVRYYSEDPLVHALAAQHYLEAREYSSAMDHAKRALTEDSNNRDALSVLIEILFAQDRYEEAIPHIKKGLESDNDVLQRYALGKALAETGDMASAIRSFTAALRIRPDDEIVRIVMEDSLISQLPRDNEERFEAGKERFERADRYLENNRTELARQGYRRGLELAPYSAEGRLKYAQIFKRSGDYGKYLSILRVVAEEGKANQNILDEIEIYESITDETVAHRWGVNQFALDRDMYRIALFADIGSSSMKHPESEPALLAYLETLLYGYEHIDVVHRGEAGSFASSFRIARQAKADYFVVFSFFEDESTFSVRSEVYHGSTGTRLEGMEVFRTGNDRVARASMRIVSDFQSLLPVRGRIYRREGERVLIDLGRFQSINPEDSLKVIRENEIELKSRSFGFDYDPQNVLGEVRIIESDELISEGNLSTSGFFDLVNPTDIVFKETEEEEGAEGEQEARGSDENDVNSSTTYKSLLRIR